VTPSSPFERIPLNKRLTSIYFSAIINRENRFPAALSLFSSEPCALRDLCESPRPFRITNLQIPFPATPLFSHRSETPGGGPLVTLERGQGVLTSFRINTCKSATKQRTLTIFIINTYEKPRGGGTPFLPNFLARHGGTAILGCPPPISVQLIAAIQ
jgi:hypothetical protein